MVALAMVKKGHPKIRGICLEASLGSMSNTTESMGKNPLSI